MNEEPQIQRHAMGNAKQVEMLTLVLEVPHSSTNHPQQALQEISKGCYHSLHPVGNHKQRHPFHYLIYSNRNQVS